MLARAFLASWSWPGRHSPGAFSWNGALRSGVLPGLSDRHEPDLETKGPASPALGRSSRVSHPGPSCPHGLRGAGRGVARGLMFHLGVEFGTQQMTIAEIHNQVMKPMTAPNEP